MDGIISYNFNKLLFDKYDIEFNRRTNTYVKLDQSIDIRGIELPRYFYRDISEYELIGIIRYELLVLKYMICTDVIIDKINLTILINNELIIDNELFDSEYEAMKCTIERIFPYEYDYNPLKI